MEKQKVWIMVCVGMVMLLSACAQRSLQTEPYLYLITPYHGAIGLERGNLSLIWEVKSRPTGEEISSRDAQLIWYMVFFAKWDEAYGEPEVIQDGRITHFPLPTLEHDTIYKWKITALFPDGQRITSEESIFSTRAHGLQNPRPPSMILVPQGAFEMGDEWTGGGQFFSEERDTDARFAPPPLDSHTRPLHPVSLTYDFRIGQFLVTFGEYDNFCDATGRKKPEDRGWGRFDRPVFNVTWWDAIAYCNWLSQKAVLAPAYDNFGNLLKANGEITTDIRQVEGYRLPTESEWEFAARDRSTYGGLWAGSWYVDDVAWYSGNSNPDGTGAKTQPVGEKQPNALGIYDMSGNLWEWCHDWYGLYSEAPKTNPIGPSSGSGRVIRGGAWNGSDQVCRVANRGIAAPNVFLPVFGFRIAINVEAPQRVALQVASHPSEGGEIQINGGAWSAATAEELVSGSQVTVQARENPTFAFDGWYQGNTKVSSSKTYTFTIQGPVVMEARFRVYVPDMVRVNANAWFKMGNTRNDPERHSNEDPLHYAWLFYDYWLGSYPVTFAKYDAFCDATGRGRLPDIGWGRGDRPIILVDWWDAIAYCNWLSQEEGLKPAYDTQGNLLNRSGQITTDIREVEGYRLPTETEWEFAARGGRRDITNGSEANDYKYVGSHTISEVAWYAENSGNRSQPVGQKKANELGLFDMSGNVGEWCHDWYGLYTSSTKFSSIGPTSGEYRVLRGGSWADDAVSCRVSTRGFSEPEDLDAHIGFRIARTVIP